MDRGIKREGFAVISVLLFCAMAMQTRAATITVTNRNDSGPGSLRQALANANNGDTINFAVTGTITLTSGGLEVTKSVAISGPGANQLSIDGNLDDQRTFVFEVSPERTLSIFGLTIRNAVYGISNNQGTVSVSRCVVSDISGAGLYNSVEQGSGGASVTIINSLVSDSGVGIRNASGTNQSPRFGPTRTMARGSTSVRKPVDDASGTATCTACMTIANSVVTRSGIWGVLNFAYGAADVTVLNSGLTGNSIVGIETSGYMANAEITVKNSTLSSSSFYGGIYSGFSTVSIANSTISGNSAKIDGGGIYGAGGTISIENSTISGNSAPGGFTGGGIYSNGVDDLSIVNSTISGNSAGTGGGIYNVNSSLHVANSTIASNSAGSGGGIYNDQGQFAISNTILNAGASGENIFNSGGTVTSQGYNLSSDDGGGYLTGPADQINTDPILGPLQDNGGPTFTHALLPGSPAIDKGNSGGVPIDQRHFYRPIDIPGIPNATGGDGSDIGAFEFGSSAIRGDFNGDGFTDYLLFNSGSRATAVWYLHDNTYVSGGYGPSLPAGWTATDVADFNGDGNPDYALFNPSTRQTAIWYLNNTLLVGGGYGPTLPSGWQLVAGGDFNGDNKPDYVLYDASTRQTAIWYLNNNVYLSGAFGPTIASGYMLSGVGDFNSDGKPDYVLYSAGTRQTAIWYLNNNVYLSGAYGPTVASGYVLSGVADFNGDGKPDYALYSAGTRQTAIWYLSNNVYLRGTFGPTLPAGWTLVAP
jgi:hypothetical protein